MAINKELVKGSTSILVLSLLSRKDMYVSVNKGSHMDNYHVAAFYSIC